MPSSSACANSRSSASAAALRSCFSGLSPSNENGTSGTTGVDRLVFGLSKHLEIVENHIERLRVVIEPDGANRTEAVKSNRVADNRLFSDYANDGPHLGLPLVKINGNASMPVERIAIRGNTTNRSRLLGLETCKFSRIDVIGNVMGEDEGNTSDQFGFQPIWINAPVDELRVDGNIVWFPNQTTYSSVIAFGGSPTRTVKRLTMENNTMTLSGQLASGAPSPMPDVFLFGGNKVFKVQTADPAIVFAATKGAVLNDVFDSPNVQIDDSNVFTVSSNVNIASGGTIAVI